MIYQLDDRKPTFKGDYFVAQNAALIGSVVMEPNSSVWWSVTIRGDNDVITPTLPTAARWRRRSGAAGALESG